MKNIAFAMALTLPLILAGCAAKTSCCKGGTCAKSKTEMPCCAKKGMCPKDMKK